MVTRDHGLTLLGLIALALIGCSAQIDEKDIALQGKDILSKAYPSCSVEVRFEGVGEGDSENAYARLTLTSNKIDSSVDAEIFISRWNKKRWEITQQSSQELIKAAREICT